MSRQFLSVMIPLGFMADQSQHPATEFDQDYFDRLHAAKDHWWIDGMLDIASALIAKDFAPQSILDAGCGAGRSFEWLAKFNPATFVGVDASGPALQRCRTARTARVPVKLAEASVTDLPFGEDTFDFIIGFDVLQHLTHAEEARALKEFRRVLAPRGRVLMRTNAAFGRRRVEQKPDWRLYSPDALSASVSDAGLVLERITAANSLSVLRGASIGIPSSKPQSPARTRGPRSLLRLEARWLGWSKRSIPFGHSLYALASKQP